MCCALIDVSLLAAEEVTWLDEFHALPRRLSELLRDAAGADDPVRARSRLHRETERFGDERVKRLAS